MAVPTKEIILNGLNLTPEDVFTLGCVDSRVRIKIADDAWQKVEKCKSFLEERAKIEAIYGVNTGFGSNCKVKINAEDLSALQVNLIRSHASGVGEPIKHRFVRMMLAMRINSLIRGNSGVARTTIEKMVAAFNKCCLPLVPEQGTVGASGDLAPLSHMTLGLIGEGMMWSPDTLKDNAATVLEKNGLTPITLGMKEGLACVNGTQFICAHGVEALVRAKALARQADVITALTLHCLLGTKKSFDKRIHEVKPHPGQLKVAARIYNLADVEKKEKEGQDAYSLRCSPQVHGMVHDTLAYVEKILTTEINSVNDNPLIFEEKDTVDVLNGGNFHGEYPAMALDFLAIAVNELANISERRIDRLVNKNSSEGLPAFLVESPGLNNGFMIPQYCAAALVSEGKVLSHPSSADSIPTCGGQEDHVSMGGFSARKAVKCVENAEKVVAIELLSACQAVNFRTIENNPSFVLSEPLKEVYNMVREKVEFMKQDRYIAPDIEAVVQIIREQKVWQIVMKNTSFKTMESNH